MKSEKNLTTLLQSNRGTLGILRRKVAQLDRLTTLLKNSLSEPLRHHCQVANVQDNCLVIMTDSSAWATQIRYLTPDLLKQLQSYPELKHIRTLRCYIDPISTEPVSPATVQRDPLSPENIRLLHSMGETYDNNDKLGQAWKRFAEHAELKRR